VSSSSTANGSSTWTSGPSTSSSPTRTMTTTSGTLGQEIKLENFSIAPKSGSRWFCCAANGRQGSIFLYRYHSRPTFENTVFFLPLHRRAPISTYEYNRRTLCTVFLTLLKIFHHFIFYFPFFFPPPFFYISHLFLFFFRFSQPNGSGRYSPLLQCVHPEKVMTGS
jgi:hypothetical protein